jgi:hypothetical protein
VSQTLSKGNFVLGKAFTKCLHSANILSVNNYLTNTFLGTRKDFVECRKHSAKKNTPQIKNHKKPKKQQIIFFKLGANTFFGHHFVECRKHSAKKSTPQIKNHKNPKKQQNIF